MSSNTINREASFPQMIGARLEKVRNSKGFAHLAEVASLVKIPESIIEDIESGNIEEHLQETYSLLCLYAEPAHTIFDGYFNSDHLKQTEGADIKECRDYVLDIIGFHKKIQGKNLHCTSIPLARGKEGNNLSVISSKSSQGAYKSSKRVVPATLQRRAKALIQQHQLYKLPVNVYQVAANLGITVSFETFPSDFYMKLKGFCYKEDEFALIGINKSHPIALQRFTIAHELHHYLYDFDAIRFLCGPENETEAFEWNAERFAAELLMPSESIQRLISTPNNVRYITVHLVAEHFGVSYEAAAIRLSNFGLLPDSKKACESLYRKKDKEKTEYLLRKQPKYLIAVFGLETGIKELQLSEQVKRHKLCGAPITDPSHTVCWRCGLELEIITNDHLRNPYRQNLSNISPQKLPSFQERQQDYKQLSFNLNIS